MKKISSLLILSFAFLMVACGPTKEQLIDLNNRMVDSQLKLSDDYTAFFDAVSTGDPAEMDKQLKKWEKDTDEIVAEIEAKEDYKETKEFKAALLKLANRQHDFVVNEAKDVVVFFEKLVQLSEEEDMDEAEFEKIMTAVTTFEEEMGEINEEFLKAQKEFAEKNDITLN